MSSTVEGRDGLLLTIEKFFLASGPAGPSSLLLQNCGVDPNLRNYKNKTAAEQFDCDWKSRKGEFAGRVQGLCSGVTGENGRRIQNRKLNRH